MAHTAKQAGFVNTKPNHSITFYNSDKEEIGVLDFNGPGLSFEGIADLSAVVFMDWVNKQFQERLEEEYNRGVKDGKKS